MDSYISEQAHLRGYQLRVLNGLLAAWAEARGRSLTVMFPRQSGKNEVSAALVACLLRENAQAGGSVVVCAPTFTPQARISMERTRRALGQVAHLMPGFEVRADGYRLRWGAAEALFLSALPEAHVAGHTASLALIADEAQEIDGDWFERQFRPMTASASAPVVMFGTAWDGSTLLEREAEANRASDREGGRVRFHHEVSWRDIAYERPAYGRFVEQQRERLGATNPLFLSQYELQAGALRGRLLSAAQLLLLEALHPRLWAPVAGERYVGGLDFGGESERADATVITIARLDGERCEVVNHVAWRAASFATMEREVATLVERWRLNRLCADATGMGAPLVASLERRLGGVIEPVLFTSASKSALGHRLVMAAETNRVGLYAEDGSDEARRCRQELRDCRRQYLPGERMQWGNDAGNDDFVTSLALCLAAADSVGPARIARGRQR